MSRTKGDHMSESLTMATVTSDTASEIMALMKEPDVNGSPSLTSSTIFQSNTSANASGTMISAESQEPHQTPELSTLKYTLTNNSGTMDIVPSASSTLTNNSGTIIPSASATEQTTPTSILTNDSGMDIAPSTSATELTLNSDPMKADQEKGEEIQMDIDHKKEEEEVQTLSSTMDIDHEKGEEACRSSSTNVALVTAPAWLTTLNMDILLEECSEVKARQGLVQSLYKFEEWNSIYGVCITPIYYCSLTNTLPIESTNYFTSQRGHNLDQKKKEKFSTNVNTEKYASFFMGW